MSIGTRVIALIVLALGLVRSVPVLAQSWLYATSRAFSGPVILREVALTPAGPGALAREVRIDGSSETAPAVTFDGRFVAWSMYPAGATQRALVLFDRRTGGTTLLPGLGGEAVMADPSALRLFVFKASTSNFVDTISVLEPGSARVVSTDPIRRLGPISQDGRDLFVSRQIIDPGGTTWRYAIHVIDPLTGALRRSLPPFEAFAEPAGIDVSANLQRLYVVTSSPPTVRVLDAISGAQLAAVTVALSPFGTDSVGPLALDEAHNRLFVSHFRLSGSAGGLGTALVFDATTLASIGGSQGSQQVIDRSQRLAVSVGGFYSRFSGCGGVNVETWSAAPSPISNLLVTLDGGCLRLAIATPPEAPTTFTSAIAGRRVTFDWTTVAGARDYQLEAGSAAGLTNLAVLRTGGAPPFVVDGVPPGTYYVRLRALNDVGPGAASIERVVIVQ